MFERFSERLKTAVSLAREEAASLGFAEVGSGLLLLGLVLEGEGAAGRALKGLGVTAEGLRAELGLGLSEVSGELPLSTDAEAVVNQATSEAVETAQNWIGTEHLLLALVDVENSPAIGLLAAFGVAPDDVRTRVERELA